MSECETALGTAVVREAGHISFDHLLEVLDHLLVLLLIPERVLTATPSYRQIIIFTVSAVHEGVELARLAENFPMLLHGSLC